MGATPFVDIWINCPDRATAEKIAEATVGEGFAACANLLAPIRSIYRWKGAVERAEEVPLVLKTRAAHFEAVATLVKSLHPYETPSIVATELAAIDTACADWLAEETGEA
ncbi:divalent-cation tolerance protein CutA [Aquamicrobium ahrensii]|uniref:Periplasmic divalent cation tolerance protein n=1 Tax=Aquamicrobium ahrensii TaxID=469551 RepID=A0ABV2KS26_9HYPH